MAFTLTELVNYGTTADQSSYATPNLTFTPGAKVFLRVGNSRAGTASVPTVAGFTQVVSILASSGRRLTVLRSNDTPPNGPITATFGGDVQTGCAIWVGEVPDGFAAPAVAQAKAQAFPNAAGPLVMGFDAPPAATSIAFVAALGAAQNTYDFPASFTDHSPVAHSTPMAVGSAADLGDPPQSISVTPSADGINHAMVIVEIAAAATVPVADITPAAQSIVPGGGALAWDVSGSTGSSLSYLTTVLAAGTTGATSAAIVGATTTTPSLDSAGLTAGDGTVQVQVTDALNQTDTATATFAVADTTATRTPFVWQGGAWVQRSLPAVRSGGLWDGAAPTPATAPTVSAGADITGHPEDTLLQRTATENNGGATITSRAWTVVSGPAEVGATIDTDADLGWTPATPGNYVLQYAATNSVGTGADQLAVGVAAATTTGVKALEADKLVDSIGVNTHWHYTDRVYHSRYAEVRDLLVASGIRYYRDYTMPTKQAAYVELAGLGVRMTAVQSIETEVAGTWKPASSITLAQTLDTAKAVADAGGLLALEAVNEPDISSSLDKPTWYAAARAHLADIQAGRDARGMITAIVGPGITWEANTDELGDITAWTPVANMHPYAGGHRPENGRNEQRATLARDAALANNTPGGRVWFTEVGYHNDVPSSGTHLGTPEDVAGVYYPRMWLHHFALGVERSFAYELVDQGTDGQEFLFGLIRNDLTPKPAYTATKNLIDLLEDPGSTFTPGRLNYTLSGANADTQTVLLQKRDGTFWLAIWQATSMWNPETRVQSNPADVAVTVNLGATYGAVRTYRPNDSTTALTTAADVSSVAITSQERVTLVSVGGAAT